MDELSGTDSVLFRRKNLGFVFQQYNLLPALTAAENAAVPLLAAGAPRKRAVDEASRRHAQLGLAQRLQGAPRQFFGHQQHRSVLAHAVWAHTRHILTTTPT